MGKHAPTIFSHTTKKFKDNYEDIFGKKEQKKTKPAKSQLTKKEQVRLKKLVQNLPQQSSPPPAAKRKKSMQESMLAERVVAEKVNTTLKNGRAGRPEKIDMNSLTEEQQRQIIFETWPGDELGLTTGKMHHDAYDAIQPVPDSTKK